MSFASQKGTDSLHCPDCHRPGIESRVSERGIELVVYLHCTACGWEWITKPRRDTSNDTSTRTLDRIEMCGNCQRRFSVTVSPVALCRDYFQIRCPHCEALWGWEVSNHAFFTHKLPDP